MVLHSGTSGKDKTKMSNKLTPEEENFANLVYDYTYSGTDAIELINALYKLIDLRINPPKETPKLKSLEEHNASRFKAYERMDSRGLPKPNGIACPKCGTELIDSDPNTTLASNPPQKNTKCPSCDYIGYRIA
jgi:hypothetical protein